MNRPGEKALVVVRKKDHQKQGPRGRARRGRSGKPCTGGGTTTCASKSTKSTRAQLKRPPRGTKGATATASTRSGAATTTPNGHCTGQALAKRRPKTEARKRPASSHCERQARGEPREHEEAEDAHQRQRAHRNCGAARPEATAASEAQTPPPLRRGGARARRCERTLGEGGPKEIEIPCPTSHT